LFISKFLQIAVSNPELLQPGSSLENEEPNGTKTLRLFSSWNRDGPGYTKPDFFLSQSIRPIPDVEQGNFKWNMKAFLDHSTFARLLAHLYLH